MAPLQVLIREINEWGGKWSTVLYGVQCTLFYIENVENDAEILWETRVVWFRSNLLLSSQMYNMLSLHKSN